MMNYATLQSSANKLHGARKACAEDRRNAILFAAIEIAQQKGLPFVTCKYVGARARVSHTLIYRYFKSIVNLRREVMKAAIANNINGIVAQGLITKDPIALRAPAELKNKLLKSLSLDS